MLSPKLAPAQYLGSSSNNPGCLQVRRSGYFRPAERTKTRASCSCREGISEVYVFRGFVILLIVVSISLGTFILYDSIAQRRAASADNIIAGAVLCSFAIALLYFVSKPVVK
jgi:hypothetical protein